jgi:hypothetical protein
LIGAPDDAVLTFAVRTGRAVVTLDRRDLMWLHRHTPEHVGIIVCTEDADVEGRTAPLF